MKAAGLVVVALAAGCATQQAPMDGRTYRQGADVAPPTQADFQIEPGTADLAAPSENAMGADDRMADRMSGDMVGSNNQPEWTTHRRFATTPAYVLAPGQLQAMEMTESRFPRHQGPGHSFLTEVGVGLEGGLEAHVGEAAAHPEGGPTKHQGFEGEVGYAFGKWGTIPLNPSIYGGVLVNHRAPDDFHAALGVADDFCGSDWQFAGNVAWTQEMGDGRHRDLGAAAGLAREVAHGVSLGGEARYDDYAVRHGGSDNEFLIGPSLQWRPMDNMHLDVVPLFGVTRTDRRDPRIDLMLVLGIDFGPEHARSSLDEVIDVAGA